MGTRGWVVTVALEDPGGSGSRTCRQAWPPSHPPALHPLLPPAPAAGSTAVAVAAVAAVAAAAAAAVVAVVAVDAGACGDGCCSPGECEPIQSAIKERQGSFT